MKPFLLSIFFLLLATRSDAADCKSAITMDLDLQEMFVGTPIVLPNQNLLFSRQNNNDWLFVKPDGKTTPFAPAAGATKAATLLADGTVAIASKDGNIHFLDQDGHHLREITATKNRYIWHLVERQDGILVLLTNRMDGKTVYGSTIFIDQQGQSKVEIDLKKNGVWSHPELLPNQSVALKTQNYSVFIIRPDASYLQLPSMGRNGSSILETFSDGTILTGGRFGNWRKLLFIEPVTGTLLSEMQWDGIQLDQDIGFVRILPQNHFVVSFAEYETIDNYTHYHERLEFYDQQKNKINEFKIKDVGFNTDWGIIALADGTLAHGAGKMIYFFSQTGALLDTLELPFYADDIPVLMQDGTIAMIGEKSINNQRESHLFKINRTCTP